MRDLIEHERFEIEILEKLNSKLLLHGLIFTGGTMLRLCHGLDRYSVDLDFWIDAKKGKIRFFKKLKIFLEQEYKIKDAHIKRKTIIIEIKSPKYPRSLKIEIREKNLKHVSVENSIAFSPFSNEQVMLATADLNTMGLNKFMAFLERGEIRDVYDLEFLYKKGVKFDAAPGFIEMFLTKLNNLKRVDYTVKLGSILPAEQRKYYVNENFKIFRRAMEEQLAEKSMQKSR